MSDVHACRSIERRASDSVTTPQHEQEKSTILCCVIELSSIEKNREENWLYRLYRKSKCYRCDTEIHGVA